MITIYQMEQGTEGWHAIRDGLITGSVAYKLLDGIADLNYVRNAESTFTGNFATKRGHLLEDRAVSLYEKIHRAAVARPGFITNTRYPGCGYSPDGIDDLVLDGIKIEALVNGESVHGELLEGVLLEVKCFAEKNHMEIFDGHIPVKIMAQVQFGLMICELKLARLIIYNPDIPEPLRAFKVIPIKANRDIHENFRRILSKEPIHA